ncbi:OmpW family outer membrane protein [Ancylomarina sp. YFZ004]
MKWWMNLICKIFILSGLLTASQLRAQTPNKELSIQLGMYDFTDELTREFYKTVPSLNLGIDLYKRKQLSFSVYSGISYTKFNYNSRKHHLVIIPLNAMGRFKFLSNDTKISPYFGSGIGLFFKTENNDWMNKSFNTISYSYLLNTGFDFPIGKEIVFSIDLKYIFTMEALDEEIDYSGISSTLGIRIPLKKNKQKKL